MATSPITSTITRSARTLARRVVGILIATAAMFIGFAVAGNAASAHADTTAGSEVFGTVVECGGDALVFTTTSTADYGSYARLWAYDPVISEWVTDGTWVEADAAASYNVSTLTFDDGYYMIYLEYAQWDGYDFVFSGEYINDYVQYYTADDYDIESFCYMGNDLA